MDSLMKKMMGMNTIEVSKKVVGETRNTKAGKVVSRRDLGTSRVEKKAGVRSTSMTTVTEKTSSSKSSKTKFSVNDNKLQVIEGIGPKIEVVLNNAGINNFSQLANTSSSRLVNILASAGSAYRVHNPKSWPEQAHLARNKEWAALIKLQKELDGGVTGTGNDDSPSKLEKFVGSNN